MRAGPTGPGVNRLLTGVKNKECNGYVELVTPTDIFRSVRRCAGRASGRSLVETGYCPACPPVPLGSSGSVRVSDRLAFGRTTLFVDFV